MSLHLYIFVVFILKNREKRKKMCQLCRVLMQKHSAKWSSHVSRTSTLPSAKTLALGKVSNVCQVLESSTRQRGHVAPPWAGTLPSARRRHSAKFECPPLGTRQSVGLEWRHVAALPSAKALGKVFTECPKSDTRQRPLCRGKLCRVVFAECKKFAEYKLAFAECYRHSAKRLNPVVPS